ncbi:hypothetical protein CYL16_01185 [Mycobacterium sp. EPG1]|nr:hypothetical protein CYL16_01185 [Mycobacterium sp. EPG1]
MRRREDRRKLATELLRRMEAAGIRESDLNSTDGFAIGLAWASTADETELARIEAEHPAMVAKLRRRLDRIEAGR